MTGERPAYLDDDAHATWATELDRLADLILTDLPAAGCPARPGERGGDGRERRTPLRPPAVVHRAA